MKDYEEWLKDFNPAIKNIISETYNDKAEYYLAIIYWAKSADEHLRDLINHISESDDIYNIRTVEMNNRTIGTYIELVSLMNRHLSDLVTIAIESDNEFLADHLSGQIAITQASYTEFCKLDAVRAAIKKEMNSLPVMSLTDLDTEDDSDHVEFH